MKRNKSSGADCLIEFNLPGGYRRFMHLAVVILVLTMVVLALPVLKPFIIAAILAYFFFPPVNWASRYLGNTVATVLFFIIVSGIFFVFVLPISGKVLAEIKGLPDRITQYQKSILEILEPVEIMTDSVTDENTEVGFIEKIRHRLNRIKEFYHENLWFRNVSADILERGKAVIIKLVEWGYRSIGSIFSEVINLFLIPVLVFYMLRDGKDLLKKFKSLIPEEKSGRYQSLFQETAKVFSGYIRGQLTICLFLAISMSFGLYFLDIDFAFIIGPLSGLFNLIPYLGVAMGFIPSIIVALLKFGLTEIAVYKIIGIIVLAGVLQTVEGLVLQPVTMSAVVDLHPVVVILALFIGAAFWGIWGMVLAVPVAGIIKVLYSSVRIKYDG